MDGRKNMLEGAGDSIWLRYSTSITIAGRTRTIEIGIPMPIGADEEEREQLLREADEGMNQLTGHVENRIAQMLQRVQPTQGNIPAPTPTAKPSVAPPPRAMSRPVSAPAPQQAAPQQNAPVTSNTNQRVAASAQAPREIREERPELAPVPPDQDEEVVQQNPPPPQQRAAATGVSMPTTGDVSGNLSIPQFIRVVKDRFDLNPTQAMEMLKLKSLSGVNLREKLDQLQRLVGADANGASEKGGEGDAGNAVADETPSKPAVKNETPSSKPTNTPTSMPAKQPTPIRPSSSEMNNRPQASRPPTTNNGRAPYFDEEEDFENVLASIEDDGELDESELAELGQQRELTPHERMHAKDLVSKFRESQGAAVANPARLKVLNNVTDGQVSEEQLQDLAEGIWGISSFRKLKVDQVESLISWAKEDDFMTDAEVVLLLLEEEAFARGNR